jgi:magnesium transporter
MRHFQIENDTLVENDLEYVGDTILLCSSEELRKLNVKFSVHTIDECTRPGPSKLEAYDGYDFIALNVIRDSQSCATYRIGLYYTSQMILFVCDNTDNAAQDVLDAFASTKTINLSLPRILYAFFSSLIENDTQVLATLEEEISAIEERVSKGINRGYMNDIIAMRKKLMFYKKYYEQLLCIAEGIEENENRLLSSGALKNFKMFTRRVDRLNRNVLNLRDYITEVREDYQSQIDINLHSILKLFTVVTVIFLPLTLLVGWYGMNFQNMPELSWPYGYYAAIAVSILFVAGSILFLKKRKIL